MAAISEDMAIGVANDFFLWFGIILVFLGVHVFLKAGHTVGCIITKFTSQLHVYFC